MPDALHREAPITAADPVARTLTVQLLRWDEARTVTDPGRPPYRESWARDSLVPLDDLYVVDQHYGNLIGRMDPPYDSGVGPASQVHIAHTRAGDDLLALVDAGVIRSVSIEALRDPAGEVWSPDHQAVTRTRGYLAGTAFAFHAAHDAPILARTYGGPMSNPTTIPTPPGVPGQAPAPPAPPADPLDAVLRSLEALGAPAGNGGGPDPAAAPPAPPPPAPAPVPSPAPAPPGGQVPAPADPASRIAAALAAAAEARQAESVDALQHQLVVMRSAMLTLVDQARGGGAPAEARFPTFGEVMRANANGQLTADDLVWLNRAIVDITTADIPGLIPKAAVAQIMQVIAQNQQLADAAGTMPFPDSGMTIDFPVITQRPTVGPITGEKVDVVSTKTHVSRDSTSLVTLAGGEDVSIQAIQRSQPSYLELMGQLYLEAMAKSTDALAWSVYDAASTANTQGEQVIGTDVALWITGLVGIAGEVLRVWGTLPDRLVLSTDLWVGFAGAVDGDGRPIFTNRSPVNPGGTASLTTTTGEVRDLAWTVDPNLPADTGCFFPAAAFRSSLGPVSTLTADVPLKLGRDYATYRFGAFASIDDNALFQFHTVAPVGRARGASKSTAKA